MPLLETTLSINIPVYVSEILNTLNKAGYDAYIVGGCVRDCLLNHDEAAINDWDITTNALPEAVQRLFLHHHDTGLKHGTITVIVGSMACEVTTYRIDGKYLDSRRPESVTFTASLEEDLARRDFTVNAMAYNPQDGLIDLYGGIKDLENGIIRCVNDPKQRFGEDALRMLRAVRFCAQLGFKLESDTFNAIMPMSYRLNDISAERIGAELQKTLVSDFASNIALLQDSGLLKVILPELLPMVGCAQNHPYHYLDVWNHTLAAINHATRQSVSKTALITADILWPPPVLDSINAAKRDTFLRYALACVRIALLFHDCGKPAKKTTDKDGIDHFLGHAELSLRICKAVMRRLKFPNKLIATVLILIKNHDRKFRANKSRIKRAIIEIGRPEFALLLELRHADISAHSTHNQEKSFSYLEQIKTLYTQIITSKECIDLAHLAINGDTLKELGYTDGQHIGATLNYLLDLVIDHPDYNNKEKLVALAMRRLK